MSIDSLINKMNAQVLSYLMPILQAREKEFISDSLRSDIKSLIREMSSSFFSINGFAARISRDNANSVNQNNKNSFISTFDNSVGVDLTTVLQSENLTRIIDLHVKENVRLIKSIPREYFARVEEVVLNGVTNGLSTNTISKQLFTKSQNAKFNGVLGITKRRAKLIARDQTAKLNGQINESRQKDLGITDYVWRSSEDARVRTLHRQLNGKTFSWKDPSKRPPDGLDPGQPINCRCIAQPVVIV